MFQGIKNAANTLSNANKMKAQQAKMQAILDSVRVTGTSKNGKVKATVSGSQVILALDIDPALITFVQENFIALGKEDTLLSKSVIEAVADATTKVQPEVIKKMQESGSLGDLMSMLQGAA
jgi:DNA-binding protein YbaB